MKKLETVNCEEIMTEPLKPIEFMVDNLITQGLFIPAGAPKIGKSRLALDICLSAAKGEPVLNAKTTQGTALYLCLEDSRIRIQNRLYEMTDEPTEHLHYYWQRSGGTDRKIYFGTPKYKNNLHRHHSENTLRFS